MSISNFAAAKALVLSFEGGISNLPDDPGGLTKWGVTQRTFSDWLKAHGFKDRPVTAMTEFEMTAIYRAEWERWRCNEMVQPWALVVMDAAINLRFGMSARLAQGALRFSGVYGGAIDGVIGPRTIAAVNANPSLSLLALHARLGYHVARTSPSLLPGLINRIVRLEKEVKIAAGMLKLRNP